MEELLYFQFCTLSCR